MNQTSIKKYAENLEGSELSYPYDKQLAVYSLDDKMFAIIEVGKKPTRISLRCDPKLADILKERYEEVMAGHKLNKDKWITIVLTGQLPASEIQGLIDHSYQLVKNEDA